MSRTGANGVITYTSEDKEQFPIGSEIREYLESGYEVTLDRHGLIVNVWDPQDKESFDRVTQIWETEEEAFPIGVPFDEETATDAELENHINSKSDQMNEEFETLKTIKRDLAKKWAEFVAWNLERDKRASGYQKRSTFSRIRNRRPASP